LSGSWSLINPIEQEWWVSVTDKRKKKKKSYDAPKVKDHGTLTDLTKGSSGKSTDVGGPPRTKP
jgi:hypothetical protein